MQNYKNQEYLIVIERTVTNIYTVFQGVLQGAFMCFVYLYYLMSDDSICSNQSK